jgi:starch phosphorylase
VIYRRELFLALDKPGSVGKPAAAYFSMEIGLKQEIPTCSGGLGVLAGDFMKSASDLEIPIIGVSLLYNRGYFKQKIENNRQIVLPQDFEPQKYMTDLGEVAKVNIEGRDVKVKAWVYWQKGITGFTNPIIYLATNGAGNPCWDEEITQWLYKQECNDNNYWRIAQEMILGIGGVRGVHFLNKKYPEKFPLPEVFHLNEGHGAFATLELMRIYGKQKAKDKTVFTTHTPVPAGHDRFHHGKISSMMGGYEKGFDLEALAGPYVLNMTVLALNMSRYANGVSKMHGQVSKEMFPGYEIDYITNGVHPFTWTSSPFQELYDKHIPEWRSNPELLINEKNIPSSEILEAHAKAKSELIEFINSGHNVLGTSLDKKLIALGFARRIAEYKRPGLPFWDKETLVDICKGKAQPIYAGKPHPRDGPAADLLSYVLHQIASLDGNVNAAFIEDYNMAIGMLMTQGNDVWLNLPRRPHEASGTSGMKASHNGVPTASTLDGWVAEVEKEKRGRRTIRQGVWEIGAEPTAENRWKSDDHADMKDFYKTLKEEIIPEINNPERYAEMMRGAIRNAAYFNSHRMVKEYLKKAYGFSYL